MNGVAHGLQDLDLGVSIRSGDKAIHRKHRTTEKPPRVSARWTGGQAGAWNRLQCTKSLPPIEMHERHQAFLQSNSGHKAELIVDRIGRQRETGGLLERRRTPCTLIQ